MKIITLTRGKVAMVDDEDFEWLSQYKWHASLENGHWYAKTGKYGLAMHRIILGVEDGNLVDHQDGNGLNNIRINLRPCNYSQNIANSIKKYKGTSQYKGVYWDKQYQKWRARIRKDYHLFHLGCFVNEKDAAKAYNQKAKELFREFAAPNLV